MNPALIRLIASNAQSGLQAFKEYRNDKAVKAYDQLAEFAQENGADDMLQAAKDRLERAKEQGTDLVQQATKKQKKQKKKGGFFKTVGIIGLILTAITAAVGGVLWYLDRKQQQENQESTVPPKVDEYAAQAGQAAGEAKNKLDDAVESGKHALRTDNA